MKESSRSDKLLYTLASIMIILFLFTGEFWLLYGALAFHFIELLFDRLAKRIDWVLSVSFHYIGRFNAVVLLTVVYYLILTPLSFAARLFGQVHYGNKKKKGNSQFKTRNYTYRPADLEEMW